MKRLLLAVGMGILLSDSGAIVHASANVPSNAAMESLESANAASVEEAMSEATESTLFQEGNGGDSAWWESHRKDARNEEEKTAVGFVLAVLKRDIGATSGRPAGIDIYIEPSKLTDVKKKLAIYDISSPSVREIRFVKLAKDDTGTCYTFKVIGGTSADAFQGFEGTLQFHIRSSSHLVDEVHAATLDPKPAKK